VNQITPFLVIILNSLFFREDYSMSKHSSDNQVLASAQRGAGAGSTTSIPSHTYEYAMIALYITAKSGAPYIDISLQCSPVDPAIDNTKWRTVYLEPRITNANIGTIFPKIFGGHRQVDFSGWLRAVYTIGGTSTPKLTFSMNIELK
jgi:hypothetical protein